MARKRSPEPQQQTMWCNVENGPFPADQFQYSAENGWQHIVSGKPHSADGPMPGMAELKASEES
jgi:hypothetical protein